MTNLRYVLAASIAIGLSGGAAVAQSTSAMTTAQDPASATSQGQSGDGMAAHDQMAQASDSASSTASPTMAGGVMSSPPVPDTPANRAKYGGPMSHGGAHTAAAGN